MLLVVDTLRADRFGCPDPKGIMPNAEAFFSEGACFVHAQSVADWTFPTTSALLSGVHNQTLGVYNASDPLPEDVPLLPDVFQPDGYLTVQARANGVAGANGISDRFLRDYSVETPSSADIPSSLDADLVLRIEEFLDGEGTENPSFFLHIQFIAPHAGYCAPGSSLPTRFGEVDLCDWDAEAINAALQAGDEALIEGAVAMYDAEASYVDARIAEVLALFEDRGLLDSTLFVFTADHGEGLTEHGHWGHGQGLTFDQIDVPLAMRGPGVPKGVAVPGVVSSVDVAPTILDLAGLPIPTTMEGRSLRPLMEHPATVGPSYAYSSIGSGDGAADAWAVTATTPDGTYWKLILGVQPRHNRLYHLEVDRTETTDLFDDPAGQEALEFLRPMIEEPEMRYDAWYERYGSQLE